MRDPFSEIQFEAFGAVRNVSGSPKVGLEWIGLESRFTTWGGVGLFAGLFFAGRFPSHPRSLDG